MNQRFSPTRAIEAAAVVARCEGKRIGRLRLLKLLYIRADTMSAPATGLVVVPKSSGAQPRPIA